VTLQETIETKLGQALRPVHLEVVNESGMHNVPAGSETHFKVLVVSPEFDGLGLLDRHRRVNDVLRDELPPTGSGGDARPATPRLHALTIRALTPSQWGDGDGAGFVSPKCLGGSKAG
jgi:BolA-like protein 1